MTFVLRALTGHALITFTAIVCLSVASGQLRAEDQIRDVAAFDSVVLGGSGILKITVGGDHSVILEGDPRLLEDVETTVKGGRLLIKRESDWSFFGRKDYGALTAHVRMPKLEEAMLAGSGDIEVKELNGGKTSLVIAGSGDIEADGKLDFLDLTINGSGDVNMPDLEVTDAEVTINGSGDVLVRVSGNLDATINGSGDIEYVGDPARISRSVRGSGNIRQN